MQWHADRFVDPNAVVVPETEAERLHRHAEWILHEHGVDVYETSVPQEALPEPTLREEEEELTDVDDYAGRQRAATLTALDRHATVTMGMGSKPVHQYCESCKAVARESPDGSCPACGAIREVDTVPLTWDDVAPEEGSESWSDEEVSIDIITIPIPGAPSSSPPPSEAGSDEEGGGWVEDSTAFFAEVHNRTGHATYQTAERRLVAPRPKTAPPEAAGPTAMTPNEAPAEASTLCSQTVESLTDFPRALLTKLLEFGGSPVPQDYVSELMHRLQLVCVDPLVRWHDTIHGSTERHQSSVSAGWK
jgi:hypothetical protein